MFWASKRGLPGSTVGLSVANTIAKQVHNLFFWSRLPICDKIMLRLLMVWPLWLLQKFCRSLLATYTCAKIGSTGHTAKLSISMNNFFYYLGERSDCLHYSWARCATTLLSLPSIWLVLFLYQLMLMIIPGVYLKAQPNEYYNLNRWKNMILGCWIF